MHHGRVTLAGGERGALYLVVVGRDGERAGDGGRTPLGSRHRLVVRVRPLLEAERDHEGQGGDGGESGGDVGVRLPQSGATNRNPTPRTVRR
ncbi:hypothetical protein GCM10022251_10130 [Phytohabitans flavus]|uniref:Uncharacterized protein n=1 Tax=Phytohabitans flavus TaxID=1076124 RepID=A0A6F8XK69_9ACTN|nr:hypothetical protein Pflav_005990 [Phytohabitans flavus]